MPVASDLRVGQIPADALEGVAPPVSQTAKNTGDRMVREAGWRFRGGESVLFGTQCVPELILPT
jgi:hypothetical protein